MYNVVQNNIDPIVNMVIVHYPLAIGSKTLWIPKSRDAQMLQMQYTQVLLLGFCRYGRSTLLFIFQTDINSSMSPIKITKKYFLITRQRCKIFFETNFSIEQLRVL